MILNEYMEGKKNDYSLILGMLGILWMLVARYFLIAQHRERYITVGAVSPLPGPATVKEHQTVPWITLLTKPAFW